MRSTFSNYKTRFFLLSFILLIQTFAFSGTREIYLSVGGGRSTTAQGEVLMPLHSYSDKVVFLDFQQQVNDLSFHHDSFVSSLGPGIRMEFNDQVIGACLFGDYVTSSKGKHYWQVAPSFDYYRGPFSAALNFYLPVGKHSHLLKSRQKRSMFISSVGSGHQLTQTETTITTKKEKIEKLPYGVDLTSTYLKEGGKWIFEGGAYFFATEKTKPLLGIRGGVGRLITSNLILKVEDQYDKTFGNRLVARPWRQYHHC